MNSRADHPSAEVGRIVVRGEFLVAVNFYRRGDLLRAVDTLDALALGFALKESVLRPRPELPSEDR